MSGDLSSVYTIPTSPRRKITKSNKQIGQSLKHRLFTCCFLIQNIFMNVAEVTLTLIHQCNNMKRELKVYSSQFNYQYGTSIHYPYSVASLVSYIKILKLKMIFSFLQVSMILIPLLSKAMYIILVRH